MKNLIVCTVKTTKESFAIQFNDLPKMNSGHSHWAVVGKERRKWRENALFYGKMFWKKEPMQKCKIVCTRHSMREPDRDNLTISFKSIIDGLVDAKIIQDDKPSIVIEFICKWEKAKMKKGFVTVEIIEVAA